MIKETQGFLLAYELSDTHLKLKFMRFFTLAWVCIKNIDTMRSASSFAFGEWMMDILLRPFSHWIWPCSNHGRAPHPYLVVTKKNRKILMRLGSGFHYRLRTSIGESRIPGGAQEGQRASQFD